MCWLGRTPTGGDQVTLPLPVAPRCVALTSVLLSDMAGRAACGQGAATLHSGGGLFPPISGRAGA